MDGFGVLLRVVPYHPDVKVVNEAKGPPVCIDLPFD